MSARVQLARDFPRCRDWRRFDRRFLDPRYQLEQRIRQNITSKDVGGSDFQLTSSPSQSLGPSNPNHYWDFRYWSITNVGSGYTGEGFGMSVTSITGSPFLFTSSPSIQIQNATATELMGTTALTSAVAGQSAGWIFQSNATNATLGNYANIRFRLALNQTTNFRIWIGLGAVQQSATLYRSNTPNTPFCGFRLSTQTPAPDTRYQCVTQLNGVTQTLLGESGGTHLDTNTHIFDMVFGSGINFLIDNSLVGSLPFGVLAQNLAMSPMVAFDNVTNAVIVSWTFFYMKGNIKAGL